MKQKIKELYRKLDKEMNFENQLIGWTSVVLTFVIIGILIKFFSYYPNILIIIINYINFWS